MINKFINAASSGGGGVAVLNDGNIKNRDTSDIDFRGDHFEIKTRGRKWVQVKLKNVPRLFAGDGDYMSGLSETFATGDFHLNTDTSILYTRLDDSWIAI